MTQQEFLPAQDLDQSEAHKWLPKAIKSMHCMSFIFSAHKIKMSKIKRKEKVWFFTTSVTHEILTKVNDLAVAVALHYCCCRFFTFSFFVLEIVEITLTKKGEATVMLKNILQFTLTLQCLNPQSRFAPEYVSNTKLNWTFILSSTQPY